MSHDVFCVKPYKTKGIPFLYQNLHQRLLSRAKINKFVPSCDINVVLSLYHVSKKDRHSILKDLQKFGLVAKASSRGWRMCREEKSGTDAPSLAEQKKRKETRVEQPASMNEVIAHA